MIVGFPCKCCVKCIFISVPNCKFYHENFTLYSGSCLIRRAFYGTNHIRIRQVSPGFFFFSWNAIIRLHTAAACQYNVFLGFSQNLYASLEKHFFYRQNINFFPKINIFTTSINFVETRQYTHRPKDHT